MPELTNATKTHANLLEAFAGESQASLRFVWFGELAAAAGDTDAAAAFFSAAQFPADHARRILDYLAPIGDPVTTEPIGATEQNLKSALVGETYEHLQLYPSFAKTARYEQFDEIAEWFESVAAAKKAQTDRFHEVLDGQ